MMSELEMEEELEEVRDQYETMSLTNWMDVWLKLIYYFSCPVFNFLKNNSIL